MKFFGSCMPDKKKKSKSKIDEATYHNLVADKLKKLENEIQYLKSKNNLLKKLHSQTSNRNENLKLKIKQIESEYNNYKLKIEKYKAENEILKSENIELNRYDNNSQNTIKELEKQLSYLESENNNHELIIKKYKSKYKKYKSESKKLKCENIELDQLYKNLLNEIENLKKQINNLESENKFLSNLEIENVNSNYETEMNRYNSKNKNLKRKNTELDQLNKYLENETEKLKIQLSDLESENNNHELKIKKYQSENEKWKCENIELDQLYKNLLNEIENLRKQINNLESENKFLNNLKIENENLKLQINKRESENVKLKREIKYLKSNNENQQSKYENMKLQMNKYKSEIENMKLQISKYESENENFKKTWKPLGFANPKGYCYLNSVVQVLGSCEDFKMDIYNCKWISTEKTKDSIFVEGLFNLIRAIRECNRANLDESLNIVQQNITESSFGDDVYKCFMNLLTRVSNVVKTNIDRPSDHFTSLPINLSEKAKDNFERFKNRNPGFVFDNFYGQLTFQTVCKVCNHVCNESFQLMKSLPLPVPTSNSSVTLNRCIDLFFNESDVELDEPMKCKCVTGSTNSLKSITKLTHGPKYLFAYLNRGSYTYDGDKNNTEVTCDDVNINLKTLEDKSIKYKLISVIDHIGDSAGGHYYCKCSFESDKWWLLNDSQADLLQNKNDIVTKNTIVFLLKKLRELL